MAHDLNLILANAENGSTFACLPHGWTVRWVDGGTAVTGQGDTIPDALLSQGVHVDGLEQPPPPAEPKEDEAGDRRALDEGQVVALSAAEEAGTLPAKDRRTA